MKKLCVLLLPLLVSGCLLESVGRIDRNIKPYGAHWVKEGMTRELRREDSWACGAANTVIAADGVIFSAEKRAAARLPSDQNDYGPDGRLTKKWIGCMQSKGYVYLENCDARCLYP
jgi:hypothetical protein